jgi:hypothetical protein
LRTLLSTVAHSAMLRLRMLPLIDRLPPADVQRGFGRRQLGTDQVLVDLDQFGVIGSAVLEIEALKGIPFQFASGGEAMSASNDVVAATRSGRREGPARSTRKATRRQRPNVEALSGTNPNDHYGHRSGSTERATNHHCERRQQVCIGLHFMPRHAVAPSSPSPRAARWMRMVKERLTTIAAVGENL